MGFSNSKPKITTQDKAILDLKVQRDKLKQYQKRIQIVLDKEVEIAKQRLKNNQKKKALLALKKKKYQEGLLEKTDVQLMNLEELVSTIEYKLVEQKVLEGLQKGNQVLQQINQEMSIENVQKLMDDTADAVAYQNEIGDILSGQLSELDEEEILAELDRIEQEEADRKALEIDQTLPTIEKQKEPEVLVESPEEDSVEIIPA